MIYLGLRLLRFRELKSEPDLSSTTLFNLLKIAFAVAAGVGAVVALVTSYRRQRIAEFADHREGTRLFNERFATAAGQLGHDAVAVRLAGVHAMAGLADDWPEQRQTCVDVLCAYLRMPYEDKPPSNASSALRLNWKSNQQVRYTIMRVISNHLESDDVRLSNLGAWHDVNLELSGAVFDGGEFIGPQFNERSAFFLDAQFKGHIDFGDAHFNGGDVFFDRATFSGSIDFSGARFTSGAAGFSDAHFSEGTVDFSGSHFAGGIVGFLNAQFDGSAVDFSDSEFNGATVSFGGAIFRAGKVDFTGASFIRPAKGRSTQTLGAEEFEAGVSFPRAQFNGTEVLFLKANFAGGVVDFSDVDIWFVPPLFDSWNEPPTGLQLPHANTV